MPQIDVEKLRREAHARALGRARRPFDGSVEDLQRGGVAMRRYRPALPRPDAAMVFLHGGYGLFGDLELQDRSCRRLAEELGVVVLSVDYRLAPEASLDDSVADALDGVALLAQDGFAQVFLCGDSAGGAVARSAAVRTTSPVSGLLLTNPNLDLTLRSFDTDRPGGPDRELSAFSFRSWARVADLDEAPRLQLSAAGLPRTLVAVGSLDALLPEARALAETCRRDGVECRLVELSGAEHGFLGTDRAGEVLAEVRRFFGLG
ncbi:alpha/beta hydrolase [Mumia sp. DW29H23]|uniref:alpha/beta hydrolase n=1 Tax=Mumia sp. DW29H23 TaxID=3421241 RepID=UPI003D684E62